MKFEQYILNVLYEQLLTEQYDSGYAIKIMPEESSLGQQAKQKAEDAGFVFGFAVKAVRVGGKKLKAVSDESKIVDDIIALIKSKPKDEYGDILNIGRKFDNPKYSYIFIEQPSIRKRVKNYIGLIQDRSLFDEIFDVMKRVITKKGSPITYYGKKETPTEIERLRDVGRTIGNIRVYNETQYTELLQEIETYVKGVNDTQLTSYWNNYLKNQLADIKSFTQIPIAGTPVSDIEDTSTVKVQKDVEFNNFIGDAKVLTNPAGEQIIIPTYGLQSVVATRGKGQGLFYGEFNDQGLPKRGESIYSTIDILGNDPTDRWKNLSNKQKSMISTSGFELLDWWVSSKNGVDNYLQLVYFKGELASTGDMDGEPGFHFYYGESVGDVELQFDFDAKNSVYQNLFSLEKAEGSLKIINKIYPEYDSIQGLIYKGTLRNQGNKFKDGKMYLVVNGKQILVYNFNNGEAIDTDESKAISAEINARKAEIDAKAAKEKAEKAEKEEKEKEKKEKEEKEKKKKALAKAKKANKNSLFPLSVKKVILFDGRDGRLFQKKFQPNPKELTKQSILSGDVYFENKGFVRIKFTYKGTEYSNFYVEKTQLKPEYQK